VFLNEASRKANNTSGVGNSGVVKINAGESITVDGRKDNRPPAKIKKESI
jgi:hypothetical protein